MGVKSGKFVVSEFQPILNFAAIKGHKLNEHLSDEQKAEMKAYTSLVDNCLHNAELWVSWYDKKVAAKVRISFSHLNYKATVWLPVCLATERYPPKTEAERKPVLVEAQRLDEQDILGVLQFSLHRPTELDALVFGHLYTLLSTQLPRVELAEIIYSFPNLSHFCTRIDNMFIKESAHTS
ncbi:hypothetical protein LSH36_662g01049 [Paralvinella palmiformis]|uniref:Uncharacterized protein n=1 Tax=Paralvinella palmiformis TaxID=53620 RepID=A0AAD9J349_9ANNE|nr:hypothetical protein LSH36_662g01049 [Paralvinella palmiformis]